MGPCERKEVSHLIVSHSKLEIFFIFSLFGTERRQLAGNFGVIHARIHTVEPEITNPPLPASCAMVTRAGDWPNLWSSPLTSDHPTPRADSLLMHDVFPILLTFNRHRHFIIVRTTIESGSETLLEKRQA